MYLRFAGLFLASACLWALSKAHRGPSDDSTDPEVNGVERDVDNTWLLDQSFLIFFMQAGFGMLESGMVRAKNAKNVILKNLFATAIGGLIFWIVGYGLAFGRPSSPEKQHLRNGFVGTGNFFLTDFNDYSVWMVEWTYSATALTIVSGSLAERTKFVVYIVLAVTMQLLVYPLVAHWVWSPDGWLYKLGVIDSGGLVHIVGGSAGLIGAIILGPRLGKFDYDTGKPKDLPGHNMTVSSLGMFILWYSWYAYTATSTFAVTQTHWLIASRIAVVTTMAGAVALLTSIFIQFLQTQKYDLVIGLFGLLSGLVCITSNCQIIQPWAAIPIGFVGGLVYVGLKTLVLRMKIDDPLDSSAIHLGCGAWSMIAVSFFSYENYVAVAYPDRSGFLSYGLFYGGAIAQLGLQLLGVFIISAYTIVIAGSCFLILKRLHTLRIDHDTELAGLDNTNHGGSAYFF